MKLLNIALFLFIFLPVPVFAAGAGIDINTATAEQLDEIAGIGQKYAQAIIDARPFSSIDDLIRVKGIGEKTLQKIKDQGIACVNCQDSAAPSGSPQASTPQCEPEDCPWVATSDNSTATVTPPSASPQVAVSPPSPIFINEVLPAPEGADTENEWFELYNSNNLTVNLNGWSVKDESGAIKTFFFGAGDEITANSFLVINRTKSKITLQNNGDGLVLSDPAGKIIDKMSYVTAVSKQSYNRTENGWQWSPILTPGKANQIPAPESKLIAQASSTANESQPENIPLQAKASDFAPSNFNASGVISFVLAIIIALGSALVVFFLKTR